MEHKGRIELNVKDLFNLKNNVSVVTGGAGHLGLALSEALLKQVLMFTLLVGMKKNVKKQQNLYKNVLEQM